MTKRTSARLQTSSSVNLIPSNRAVSRNFYTGSQYAPLEIPEGLPQQASKLKKISKAIGGRSSNDKITIKSEKCCTNSIRHRQKVTVAPKTSYLLRRGVRIGINDHVYFTQSGFNNPQGIGRVIDFIKNRQDIEVKVAVYYRQKDLEPNLSSEKYDPRKLFATFYCEKFLLKEIQGKNTVIHLNYINDMKRYTQLDDHFYFDELYDDFSTNIYKLIPTEKVTNMPKHYINILREKYHFLATEPAQINEYLKEFQVCSYCNEWCSEQEIIECSSCKKAFHKKCIATPIQGKPRKGYLYECIECDGNARDEIEEMRAQNSLDEGNSVKSDHSDRLIKKRTKISYKEKTSTNPCSNNNNRPIIKEKNAPVYVNTPLRSTEGWIYRYLGKNSYLEDLDDPYDSIYPRSDSRLGSKYQAVIPKLLSSSDNALTQPPKHSNQYTKKKAKKLRYIPLECLNPIFQAKSEEHQDKIQKTIELIRSKPLEFSIPVYSESFLNKAVRLMDDQTLSSKVVIEKLKSYSILDFNGYLPFTEGELNTFEKEIYKYGEDIEKIAESFPNRHYPQVVEYFYKWASKAVGNKGKSTFYKTKLRNMAKIITHGIEPLYIDDDRDIDKLVKARSTAHVNSICAHCRSKLENLNYQLDRETTDDLKISGELCFKCYTHWTKYFQLPTLFDGAANTNKKNSANPVKINWKEYNEHKAAVPSKDEKEKWLIKNLSYPERSKQLKQNLMKSRYDSSFLCKKCHSHSIEHCAADNSINTNALKCFKSFELALQLSS